MEDTLYNKEVESEENIEWVLKRARDLFKDNKELILSKRLLCPLRQLQSLTMTTILPSYIELIDTLVSMSIVFEYNNKPIEKEECDRLVKFLFLYRKEKNR